MLDVHCYYSSTSSRTIDGETVYANNYEHSGIRTWLNDDFYNSAFALGKSNILTTTVDNSASSTDDLNSPYASNNTQDKIFLLSYKDYINSDYGFSTETGQTNTRSCKTTDWARARGSYYNTGSYPYNGLSWTRSPCGESYRAWEISYSGAFRSYDNVDGTSGASVRPALSIKIA